MSPIVANLTSNSDRSHVADLVAIALVMLGAAVLHLWGIGHELPFVLSDDELLFVRPALDMGTTGNLNPGFFGHPGSTVIYPLGAICWLLGITALPEAVLAGRLLTSFYAVLTLPALYVLARHFVGRPAALAATALTAVYPVATTMSQWTRTDSAATLFSLLALIAILDLLDAPTRRRHAIVGLWIGLAVASRYFMAALLVPYVLAHLLRAHHQTTRLAYHARLLVGIAVVIVTFIVTTPFFVLDFTTALAYIRNEARAVNPGGDGLSHVGNLAWYATAAIPEAIGWPMLAMVAASLVLALARQSAGLLLIASYVAAYFVAVSMSNLHWGYYIIPVLPIFALLAFTALEAVTRAARPSPIRAGAVVVLAVVLFGAAPLAVTVRNDILAANPTTRLLSRDWVLANLPQGSSIAQEWYTAPIDGEGYVIEPTFTLTEHTFEHYRSTGIRYLIAASWLWDRFYADPARYPAEVAFYNALLHEGRLLATFAPSQWTGGPEIKVFELQ